MIVLLYFDLLTCPITVTLSYRSRLLTHWRTFLTEHSLGLEWLKLYPVVLPPTVEPVLTEGADEPLKVDELLEVDEDGDELALEDPTDPDFEERFCEMLDS
jgi:hypothetical protein